MFCRWRLSFGYDTICIHIYNKFTLSVSCILYTDFLICCTNSNFLKMKKPFSSVSCCRGKIGNSVRSAAFSSRSPRAGNGARRNWCVGGILRLWRNSHWHQNASFDSLLYRAGLGYLGKGWIDHGTTTRRLPYWASGLFYTKLPSIKYGTDYTPIKYLAYRGKAFKGLF